MRNQKDHVSRVIGLYLDSVDKEELNEQYFVDPALWAKDFLGIDFYWKQREISEAVVNNANVAIKAGHGVGKAALLTCLLPTPTGWTTIGDVQVGEYVLDEAGRPNKVTHKSPIWDMDAYDVSFDDGTRLRVNGPHEWNVLDLTARSRKDGTKSGVDDWRNYWHTTRSIETRELFDLGVTTTAGQKRWRIPTAAPLDLPDADLPIDPYLLGFWLGDGSSHCGNITIGETKFGLIDWLTDHGYSIRIKDYFKEKGSILITVDGLGDSLESLGVLRNKHIPMAYLRGGLKQRRELLAGLMDSDGFLMKSGAANAGIDLCHKRLSSDVYELLMTLGCKVFRSEGEAVYTLDGERHVTGTRYRMNWTPLENPFKLRGAGWDGSKAQRSRHTQRTIVAIDRVADEPTQCISVESDSHLYLMGDSFVPTHNSFWAAILACWWIDTRPIEKVFVASTAPSADQVTGVLWREIRKAHQLSHRRYTEYKRLKALGKDTGDLPDRPLPGYITQDNRWKDDQGNILGQGRKPPDNKAEDAFQGFHDGHVLALGDESCHDDKTDVLTRRGWLNWSEVNQDDEFLSWNTELGITEYLRAEKLIAYKYSGEMYHYKNNETDFMVTPNHSMLYETVIAPGAVKRAEMQDIVPSNKYMYRNIPSWDGDDLEEFVIPAVYGKRKLYPEYRFKSEDWASFLGWVGSEGSLSKQGYEVRIWQNKIENRNTIRDLLTRMGFDFTEDHDHFRVGCGRLAKFLMRSGRTTVDKRVPEYVKGWSKRLIDHYLDAYIAGDGYCRQKGVRVIYTSGVEMANDLQELALKAGYGSTLTERPPVTGQPLADGRRITSTRTGYVITIAESNRKIKLRHDALSKVQYDGMVYCATLPRNNTLFTRRNGKTLWSGNCGLSEGMIDGLDNITSNSNSRRVLIGNPTNPASHFGKIFRENTGAWSFHTISIFDSPNFHGGGRCSCHKDEPLGLGMPEDALSKLTNQEYVDNKKREYGEDSPRYIARVLGEFAYDAGNTLFSEFDLAQAKNSVVFPDLEEPYVVLGVDIARMGQDSTYVYKSERGLVQATHPETGEALGYDLISEDTHEPIVGYKVRFLEKWKDAPFVTRKMPNGKEVEGTAERVHGLALAHGAKEVRVDASGFGQGVLDPLFVLCDGKYEIVEVYGSSTENIDRRAYHNERAFRFSEVRRMFFQGLIDVAPEDEDVIDELGGIIYDFSITSGGMLIEAKEAMKKRGVKSPDAADAFSYAAMNYDYLLGDPFRGYGRGDIIRGENENVPTSWEPSSLQYSW